jgi:hypothetical protein
MAAHFLLSVLLSGAAALTPAERSDVDAVVLGYYKPYSMRNMTKSSWEIPMFTAEVSALIAHWQRVMPSDEPDDLNDGDWLCLCQDWDHRHFRATTGAHRRLGRNAVQVSVNINLGEGETRTARLVLKREGGQWKLDDIFASDFPRGLKVALRNTIAADERHGH